MAAEVWIAALLLTVLLVALPAARLGRPVTEYSGEVRVRNRIEELGGEYSVLRRTSFDNYGFQVALWWGFSEIYDRVVHVDLSSCPASQEDLELLAQFVHLELVALRNTIASDDVVQQLAKGCLELKDVDLCETRITNKAMDYIGSMPSLEVVNVSDTQLTDGCAQALQKLSHLRTLDTTGTRITVAALCAVRGRKFAVDRIRAEVQRYDGYELSSDGMNIFTIPVNQLFDENNDAFVALRNLNCTSPDVSFFLLFGDIAIDECLRFAAKLPRIIAISVNSQEITDRGIVSLRYVESLRFLHAFNASVSTACLETLPPNLDSLILPTSARANLARTDVQQILFWDDKPDDSAQRSLMLGVHMSIAAGDIPPSFDWGGRR